MPSMRTIALQAGITLLVMWGLNQLRSRSATADKVLTGTFA